LIRDGIPYVLDPDKALDLAEKNWKNKSKKMEKEKSSKSFSSISSNRTGRKRSLFLKQNPGCVEKDRETTVGISWMLDWRQRGLIQKS